MNKRYITTDSMRLVLYAVMFDGNPHIKRQLGGKIISCLWLHCPGSRKIASKLARRCERISEINTGICIDDNAGNYHLTSEYIGY